MTKDTVEQAAPKKLVVSLIRKSNETKTCMQSVAGELGVEIQHAVENKHLHAAALKLVAKLSRMDGDKCAAFLGAFDLYRTYAEEARLFSEGHVGDLVEAAEAGEDVSAGNDNVRKLRGGIKQLEEDEDAMSSVG